MHDPRDIPMIFTGRSVRDILARRKRCTRRLIRGVDGRHILRGIGDSWAMFEDRTDPGTAVEIKPRWRRGDRLWVKEQACNLALPGYDEQWIYRADGECALPPGVKWCSPLFMPKRAVRVWLRVERVQAEHIQDVTEEGAREEGYASRAEFVEAWDGMHKAPDDMAGNRWVFAVWFELLEGEDG